MKKGIKILLGILIPIIILCITYVILVFKGILPNPFLDTKDLVCSRDSSNASLDDKVQDEKIFKFNNQAILKSYEEKTIYTFTSEGYAKAQYEYAKENNSGKVKLEKNVVTISRTHVMEKDKGFYGKTKEEIRKIYEDEFDFECE